MSRDRFLVVATTVALVEGVVIGYVFCGVFSGNGLDVQYWLLMGAIVGISTLVGSLAVRWIVRRWQPRQSAACVALVVGPLLGLIAGYLLQPRDGPV
jgi:predicted MFS family arabinose efflux permease